MSRYPLILGFVLLGLFHCCHADPGSGCSRNSSLMGFESEFVMVQHQLRGIFSVVDDCSFRVDEFDMLQGSDVRWWGASGVDFENISAGGVISDDRLNKTYKNDSLVVHLSKNVTWDKIGVLAVWDIPQAADFGHIVLNNVSNSTGSSLAPAPSPSSDDEGKDKKGKIRIYRQPTMFENCKVLSPDYRFRWTLKEEEEEDLIEIGLEAATGTINYMAFGWANPNKTSELMINADVAVTGFTEEGMPFADDYYITAYSECMINKDGLAHGVCPDTIYENSDPVGLVNNTRLVYGHRKDGVSFIRYQRPLKSVDKNYDLQIDSADNMTIIWAVGLIRPPDTLRPYYLPQNHGGPWQMAFGYLKLNLSQHVNDCLGPLDAADKEDQDLIIADANVPLIVSTGPALHYPNPPNSAKVIYINKKEAPVLRVERGVPVKFSIQAGHDVAFYVTSDLLGGNATLRNDTEIIYAGGAEAEGVPSSPYELTWAPGRNTPDRVYYQSLFQPKMGWRVQVVDGGLADMYNNSVLLDDQQVTFFWTLTKDSISIAARGEKKSGYLAIGFGSRMVGSFAYIAWFDPDGVGKVNTYWIDGQDASSIHPTKENLTYTRCKTENGIITMEFTRPLKPACKRDERPECNNIIEPTTPLKMVWAMGARWTDENLSERNMHSITSNRPVRILLLHGSAEAEQDLRPVLAVHGFMMFLAWGILLPAGVLAARYLKHVKGDGWFQIHVYLQYSGLAIVLLGLLFAVAELRGFHFQSVHVKFGTIAILFASIQLVNASMRPKKPENGEAASPKRIYWEYLHVISGRSAIVLGMAALITGMRHLGDRYGSEDVHDLTWPLISWFLVIGITVLYLEYREQQGRRDRSYSRSNWVLGNSEEDDSTDLLSPSRVVNAKDLHPSDRMEIQLEPLSSR
ncbi:unnamed protein product [Rhodiola kirilowii]